MVQGGLLGRKSGRGFHAHPPGAPALPVAMLVNEAADAVWQGLWSKAAPTAR